jgi:predicted TIM-barrel fold metal-dependent hydrolase
MLQLGKSVDADGHVLEPPDLWKNNLETKFKDRALGLARDEEGVETVIVEGHFSPLSRGFGIAAAFGQPGEVAFSNEFSYMDGPPGAYDPHARIKWMDEEGIDASVLYPTMGLTWEGEVNDPELATAYCRVYNDWVTDFCRTYPDRLYAVAHISLMDVERAVVELKRAAKLGVKGVMLTPHPANGKAYGDTYYDPFWAVAQDLGLPVGLHVIARPGYFGSEWYQHPTFKGSPFYFLSVTLGFDIQASFVSFFEGGTLERFPRLKLLVLEVGAGWVPHFIERMDSKWEHSGFMTACKRPPSEYFRRQVWAGADVDESMIPPASERWGSDKFFWSSDFPHFDGFPGALKTLKKNIAKMPSADQQNIIGDNATRAYNL